MNRMGCELLLCVGVFATLSVYECLRVAYHRQLAGDRRRGVAVPAVAFAPFWRVVARVIGIVSGMYLYEKLSVRYHWRVRAAKRRWLKRQAAELRVGLQSDRENGSMGRNNFAIASRTMNDARLHSRGARKDRTNG